MNKNIITFGVVLISGVAIYWGRKMIAKNLSGESNKNVLAALDLIGKYESAGQYNKLYGGGTFSDFSKHPHAKVPFLNPKTGKMDYSTAAGKYQINWPTYLEISAFVSVPDFSPKSQDILAIALLKMIGAYPLLVAGDFNGAMERISKRWASMPMSTSGQRKISFAVAKNEFIKFGGAA